MRPAKGEKKPINSRGNSADNRAADGRRRRRRRRKTTKADQARAQIQLLPTMRLEVFLLSPGFDNIHILFMNYLQLPAMYPCILNQYCLDLVVLYHCSLLECNLRLLIPHFHVVLVNIFEAAFCKTS